MTEPVPEPTQLDRIEAKLDSLITQLDYVKENGPKWLDEVQKKLDGSMLGKVLLRALTKSE
jgi:hypothetical protein